MYTGGGKGGPESWKGGRHVFIKTHLPLSLLMFSEEDPERHNSPSLNIHLLYFH